MWALEVVGAPALALTSEAPAVLSTFPAPSLTGAEAVLLCEGCQAESVSKFINQVWHTL